MLLGQQPKDEISEFSHGERVDLFEGGQKQNDANHYSTQQSQKQESGIRQERHVKWRNIIAHVIYNQEYLSFVHEVDIEKVIKPTYHVNRLRYSFKHHPTRLASFTLKIKNGELAGSYGKGCYDKNMSFPSCTTIGNNTQIPLLRYGGSDNSLTA